MVVVDLSELRTLATSSGLARLVVTGAGPLVEARRVIEERKAAGINGSMQFTYKNPARSTDPQALLPGARSILVGARSYHRHLPPPPPDAGPVARVARYMWADDQEILLAGLGKVADHLKEGGWRACVVSDQNHLVDRAVAERAGLGWYGKNANLLIPGAGSWFILGSVLTDAEVVDDGARPEPFEPAEGCGTCIRCIPACPTGAIVAPGVVDARLCLSWLLQATGPFPIEHREALGDRIYGCDECQDVCPPNRVEIRRAAPGGGGSVDEVGVPSRAWVAVLDLLESSDEQILAAHGRWYIPRREVRYLRRNALVVLGNTGDGRDPRVRRVLDRCLADPDGLIRSHAVWSARRLGCDDLLVELSEDPDPMVAAELAYPVRARDVAEPAS